MIKFKEFLTETEDLKFLIENYERFENSEISPLNEEFFTHFKNLNYYQFLFLIEKVLMIYDVPDESKLLKCVQFVSQNIESYEVGNDALLNNDFNLHYFNINSQLNYYSLDEEISGRKSEEKVYWLLELLTTFNSLYFGLQCHIQDNIQKKSGNFFEFLKKELKYNNHYRFSQYINDSLQKSIQEARYVYNPIHLKTKFFKESILVGNDTLTSIISLIYPIHAIKLFILNDLKLNSLNEDFFESFKLNFSDKIREIEIYEEKDMFVDFVYKTEVVDWLRELTMEKMTSTSQKINPDKIVLQSEKNDKQYIKISPRYSMGELKNIIHDFLKFRNIPVDNTIENKIICFLNLYTIVLPNKDGRVHHSKKLKMVDNTIDSNFIASDYSKDLKILFNYLLNKNQIIKKEDNKITTITRIIEKAFHREKNDGFSYSSLIRVKDCYRNY